MRDFFGRPERDPAGDIAMIENHARLAGYLGLPRQEFSDDEAETAASEGYARGLRERLEAETNRNAAS